MTTSGARVQIEALEAGYGRTKVLSGIDLDIPPGRFVALIGASGCGKTTLLRTISGFITPDSGRVLFDGVDVTDCPPERRNTAMVFQSYALWPHMTVEQQLAYGLKVRGWRRADIARRVDDMLVLLDLNGYGPRKVTALSGGQRQRVALGRALAIDPPILLLDEPLSNLDAKIRVAMRHEIRALQERIGFTAGWIYAFAGDADKLIKGPYDKAIESGWEKAFASLKDFNTKVTMTPGNAGTLDMLNRGEIAMGPVWVDMFYTWQADGKLAPNMKLKLIAPGMPGQPMYYAIPGNSANNKLAKDFVALAKSPEVQAEGIVKRFNWYPGIDAKNLAGKLDKAAWDKLFSNITPDDLSAYGKSFPIAPYFNDILQSYKKNVAN